MLGPIDCLSGTSCKQALLVRGARVGAPHRGDHLSGVRASVFPRTIGTVGEDTAPRERVAALVERFRSQEEAYRMPTYNETQVRREFLDEFFEALGWDVSNREGRPEGFKDVIHEDRLRIEGSVKAPDYCFTLGGERKFFVEAKKPSVNIREDQAPAYQLRRYAWSANLPLGVLTDFEEFAVYDCRIRPAPGDRASVARLAFFTFEEFDDKWAEILALFSRDAVEAGSLERFAAEARTRRGTEPVDKAFLKEIEEWREILAQSIAAANSGLSMRELNFAVTRTIDRIVFLRICEDRGMEPYGQLRDLFRSSRPAYESLLGIFKRADDKYNSGLFHFHEEKGRPEMPDALTPRLLVDDEALRQIVDHLYFPDSPYEFSVLPTETLGSVYEQFIGRVIRFSSTEGVLIEDKPEVAKAGGITYTPSLIVDEIVPRVLDPLLEGSTPASVESIRILDPACGSGTFLLAAYQHLLDWHLNKYLESSSTVFKSRTYESAAGEIRLTVAERKRILLNNIFGVDLDAQAVEVAKLSLLLKVLEGESESSLGPIALFHERALPDLGANIKSGNTLIEFDVLPVDPFERFDESTRHRINPFSWEEEFPTVMSAGGFDAIVGNPPYIRVQTMHEYAPVEVEYFKTKYSSADRGNFDIYAVFVERGLQLLQPDGRLGFILPHKFFNASYGQPLRSLLSSGSHVEGVVHFGHQQVFDRRSTYTCLLFLTKRPSDEIQYEEVSDLLSWGLSGETVISGEMPSEALTASDWRFLVGHEFDLFNRLESDRVRLSDVTSRIFQGLKTGGDRIYIVDELEPPSDGTTLVHSRATNRSHRIETSILHELFKGGDAEAFHTGEVQRRVIFPYETSEADVSLFSPDRMERDFPFAWDYLTQNREALEGRDRGAMAGPAWYAYSRNQALDVMPQPKIFCRELTDSAAYVSDRDGSMFFTGGAAGGYGLISIDLSSEYLLGLLNSKLLDWFVKRGGTALQGGYYSFEARFIRNVPIRRSNAATRRVLEGHVRRIEELFADRDKAELAASREMIEREIASTRAMVDDFVFDLYEVSEAERRAVIEASF